ncbi:MAG: hypothetical protein ABFD25_20450 [Clostridiaceae bacterium]
MEDLVRIKMPDNIIISWPGLMPSRKAIIKGSTGDVLWEGNHGENASFSINNPTNIIIELGDWTNPVSERVEPKRNYSIIQDMGAHCLATFKLTEIK